MQTPEAKRIPCINDVVFMQGRRGVLFRVVAVYFVIQAVDLAPISRTIGFGESGVSWSALRCTGQKWWWCSLKDRVRRRFTGP